MTITIEGHGLVTSYPAAWCQCGHGLRWDQREQDHSAHLVAEIQAQAFEAAAVRVRADWEPHRCPWVGFLDDEAARLRGAP